MKEQFDKELRNHIKDTFGAFDDHLADDGWCKLNDRKKKKRRAFIFWYILPSGMAASIAMLLLLNQDVVVPVGNEIAEEKIETLIKQNPTQELNKSKSENANLDKKTDLVKKNSGELKIVEKENLETKRLDLIVKKEQTELFTNLTSNKKSQRQIVLDTLIEKEVQTLNSTVFKDRESTLKVVSTEKLFKTEVTEAINNPNYIYERIQKIAIKEKEFIAPVSDFNLDITIKPFEESIAISQKLATINPAKANIKNKNSALNNRKFNIGIDANTYVNFSENGVNDKINLGLGLISEIKLTKQLSINTGISLNSQNSTFNGNQKSSQDFLRNSVSFSNIATVPSAQITSAKLVGFDIPLNLKYAVKLGKTNSFIASGFSSYSLINEKYINKFSVINYSFAGVSTSNVTSVNNNPEGQFSYFKFARTLDISVGILYPFSKKTTLSIEPFMKYPLSGLGYQDLKIGSSGISLKMNFDK